MCCGVKGHRDSLLGYCSRSLGTACWIYAPTVTSARQGIPSIWSRLVAYIGPSSRIVTVTLLSQTVRIRDCLTSACILGTQAKQLELLLAGLQWLSPGHLEGRKVARIIIFSFIIIIIILFIYLLFSHYSSGHLTFSHHLSLAKVISLLTWC